MPIYLGDDDLNGPTARAARSWWELFRMARRHNRRVATAMRPSAPADEDGRVTISVVLTPRQAQQLLAVADELGLPMHALGQSAIVAYLETHGHHPRGRVKR